MNPFCYGLMMHAYFLGLPGLWDDDCYIVYSGCYDGIGEDAVTIPHNLSVRIFY